MKIGLIGAQGVGKTTLLNALANERCFKNYAVCDEVTRWVREFNLAINEDGNDQTQELIALKHIYNIRMHPKMITDRTMLDCLVYTRWLHENNKVSDKCLSHMQLIFDTIWSDYDYTFYIEPEFDIEDDGVRSTNLSFRDRIVKLFDQALFEDVWEEENCYRIGGSVQERVDRIKQIIGINY